MAGWGRMKQSEPRITEESIRKLIKDIQERSDKVAEAFNQKLQKMMEARKND